MNTWFSSRLAHLSKHGPRGILAVALVAVTLAFSAFSFAPMAHAAATTPASPSISLACPPTISQGSQGAAVVTLQQALNELYLDFDDSSFWENSPQNAHPPLSVDGIFGPSTHAAVIDFQTWNSPAHGGTLTVDGIVGPNTWHYLHKC